MAEYFENSFTSKKCQVFGKVSDILIIFNEIIIKSKINRKLHGK